MLWCISHDKSPHCYFIGILFIRDGRMDSCKDTPSYTDTVKPRYSAPTYNIIPLIVHTKFGLKKCFHNYLYVGNSENLSLEHNFGQFLEMR